MLPMMVPEAIALTNFAIVDMPSHYNMILGRSWVHRMKADLLTFRQALKYPTLGGVNEIKGEQVIARCC